MNDLKDAALAVAVLLLRDAMTDEDPEIRNAARVLAERVERRYGSAQRIALATAEATTEPDTDEEPTGDVVVGLKQVSVALQRLKLG